ncbi:MAG: PKD domain-containing protein [Planctomycetales bacterium]|nr:PKD domain-containing protein [bacterium]UNM08891.1 MAG: PKD domain-containing protein [Planctomycetales bacterium]
MTRLGTAFGGVLLALAMLAAGCGSSGPRTGSDAALQPVIAGTDDGAMGLPAVSELLRYPSTVANQQDRGISGTQFCSLLPHRNAFEDKSAKVAVLSPGDPQPGHAYALYRLAIERSYAEGPALDPVVNATFTEFPEGTQAFFLVANLASGRWEISELLLDAGSGDYRAEFSGWQDRDNEFAAMFCGVLVTGSGPARLKRLRFGELFRPEIDCELQQSASQAESAELSVWARVYEAGDDRFGGIASVEVDYDNDGSIDELLAAKSLSVYESEAPFVLLQPGHYTPRLLITSGTGETYEHFEDAWLGQPGTDPPLADLQVAGAPYGLVNELIQFDASASAAGSSPISGYDWFINGRRLGSSTEPVFEYSFPMAGSYRLSVRVSDGNFNTSSAELRLLVNEVEHGWQSVPSSETSLLGFENRRELAVIAGHPALLTEYPVGQVNYLRALDPEASSWPTVSVDVLGPDDNFSNIPAGLLEINGKPAVFYVRDRSPVFDDELLVTYASDVHGSTWSDPQLCFSEEDIIADQYLDSLDVQVIAGKPAIFYRAAGEGKVWKYRSATDAMGLNWNAATQVSPIDPQFADFNAFMTEWNGKPCVAWQQTDADNVETLCFSSASVEDGSAWNDAIVTMENDYYGVFSMLDFEIINGRPAIYFGGYFAGDCPVMDGGGGYLTALDDNAETWSTPVMFSRESMAFFGNLLELDGLPAIVMIADPYLDGGGSFGDSLSIAMSIAEDPLGTRWSPPVVDQQVLDSDYYGSVFYPREICLMVDGVPTAVLQQAAETVVGAVFY